MAIPTRATSPDTYLVECLHGCGKLSLAAIHHHQLRERLSFGHHPRIAPVKHLLHRGEVICPYHSLYIEMPVVALRRLAVAEHHATRHRIRALDI